MIRILDEITLDAEHIDTVMQNLAELYLPSCGERGLSLEQRWVSPPVAVPGQANTLWLLWQVPDVWGYYGMRSRLGPQAMQFWARVDGLCLSRRRHVLGDAGQPLEHQGGLSHVG